MEHLSAEERACLMYLEETIEALEVQEDSGLSNDEAEPVSLEEKLSQIRVEGRCVFHAVTQRTSLGHMVEISVSVASSPPPTPPDVTSFVPEPGEGNAEDKVECPAENEAAKPNAQQHTAHPHAKMLHVLKDENGKLKIVSNQPAREPEVDPSMIPPPSDFMDELEPLRASEPPPTQVVSAQRPQTVDVEALCRQASAEVAQELPDKPAELSEDVGHHVTPPLTPPPPPFTPPPPPTPTPPLEVPEPKSPPAVAPKPKRLPANILLKSHRSTAAAASSSVSEGSSGFSQLPNPQRVHMEALRKLGLLKSDETDSGPALSPRLSPQTRRSWAAPSPPVSPRTPPATPSYSRLATPPPSSPLPQAPPSPPSDPSPFIVPAPAAFCDFEGPSRPESEPSTARDASGTASKALSNTPPRGALAFIKHLTPPRNKGTRSATIERSGSSLSSYAASQDPGKVSQDEGDKQSPGQLRNTRPRPASLGSRQELSGRAKGGVPQVSPASSKEPDLRRSLPTVQPSSNSSKLPRSQGISVLISPRSENGDERREALRRLGLLRD